MLHAQLLAAVVESLKSGLWEQWGIRSPEHWLAWQTGMSPARARQLIDTARRASELPVTMAAFADGELSVDQVVTVAKYAPAHNDAEVCEFARAATVNQLRHALSKYVHIIEPIPISPTEAALTDGDVRNSLVRFFDEDSRYSLQLNAPGDQSEIINKAIKEARDALFLAGHKDVTWLEAFVEVCNRSLGTITSPSRRDRFRTYMHLNTDDAGGPARAWFNGGCSVPDSIRDVLLCDGIVRPLWHTAGVPLNVGRARHIVPAHTRRQVLDRDRCCLRPGCGATTHLEVHHIRHWIDGGTTDTCNLGGLCPSDHDAHHRGEFTMTGNPDIPGNLEFHDQYGRLIPGVAKPNPPNGPTTSTTTRQEVRPSNRRALRRSMVPTHRSTRVTVAGMIGKLAAMSASDRMARRIFLPFADDDPKTAEVIAKVLLLARDTQIKDPSILEQLRS